MSTHRVDVIEVLLEQHPNADTLSVVKAFDYPVVVKTSEWKNGDLGAYIPPDSIVPTDGVFAFLGGQTRVRARKFRGIQSFGLLVKAPDGAQAGDDVAEVLGVTHYEPATMGKTSGECVRAPRIKAPRRDDNQILENVEFSVPVYDLEAFRRYTNAFENGEDVQITEKIHGTNSRFVFYDGEMYCGSRKEWKKQHDQNLWWVALAQNPWMETLCHENEGTVFFAETYGWVQNLKYGEGVGKYKIKIFDVFRDGRFLDLTEIWSVFGWGKPGGHVNDWMWVPVLYNGQFQKDIVYSLSTGNSIASTEPQIREGCVVRPVKERFDRRIGRVILKEVSPEYLEAN